MRLFRRPRTCIYRSKIVMGNPKDRYCGRGLSTQIPYSIVFCNFFTFSRYVHVYVYVYVYEDFIFKNNNNSNDKNERRLVCRFIFYNLLK